MNSPLDAPGFPEVEVRERARHGRACAFPPLTDYGRIVYGAGGRHPGDTGNARDLRDTLDALRLVPPIFMEQRLEKLIELGREPLYSDVETDTEIGGFRSPLPVFVSAFGSTQVARADLGVAVSRQAGRLGVPMVIGENIVPMIGYGRLGPAPAEALLGRINAYGEDLADGVGGVVVQQSTEDADAEVWNLVYSDPSAQPFLETGRLAFELKLGQGAKPGLGGMTALPGAAAAQASSQYALDPIFGGTEWQLRSSTPGTYTEEILRQQIHLMRNNFPRAKTWVKLHPGRDVRPAASIAWSAGADAVTVDGAEGGTGWAPTSFLDHVGLPLLDCLRAIGRHDSCLLTTGRMWEGTRAVKSLALGARAVGLGRAALLACDEDPERGLQHLVECLDFEMRMLISALGKYRPGAVSPEDVGGAAPTREGVMSDGQSLRG